MSKATIIAALGDGQYTVDLNFNTEVIEFNIERLRLRRDDINNTDLPQAETNLADVEIGLTEASDRVNELIRQLEGKPSDELFDALNAAASALTSADALLDNTITGLLGASSFIAIAAASLPMGATPEEIAAIALAGSTTGIASGSVNDEQDEVNTAQGQISAVISLLSGPDPDLAQAQSDLAAISDQLNIILVAHAQAVSDINFAQGKVQAARNLLPGDPSYDASRTALDNALGEFSSSISPNHGATSALYSTAQGRIGAAQLLLLPGREEVRKALKDALKALNDAGKARAIARLAVDSLNLELEEIVRRLAKLEAIPKTERRSLWCADLKEDLQPAAEVGTLEIPGELGSQGEAVIRPAFDNTQQWNRTRDGWITPCQALTPSATFYNLAILPGWQVFKPTFRFATVQAINEDGTLKVALISPNISSQQSLNVTPKSIPASEFTDPPAIDYDSVPVHYMDCDSLAFAVGDEVVLEYQTQKAETPRVIGFRDHPRPCCPYGIVTPFGGLRKKITEGVPGWEFVAKMDIQYGEVCWYGRQHVLSWRGTGDRYHGIAPDEVSYVDRLTNKIFYNDKELTVAAPGRVVGACIHYATDPSQPNHLIAVAIHEADIPVDGAGLYTAPPNGNMPHQFYRRPWPVDVGDPWEFLTEVSIPNPVPGSDDPVMVMHPWLFNEQGTEGRTMFYSPMESPFGGPMYFDHEIRAAVGASGVTTENLGNNPDSFSTNTGPYTVMVDYAGMTLVTMQITLTSAGGVPFDAFHDHATITFGEQSLLYELFTIDGHGGDPNAAQVMQDFFTYLDPARGSLAYLRRDYPFPENEGGTTVWEVWKNGEIQASTPLDNPPISAPQTPLRIAVMAGAADRQGNLAALVTLYGDSPPTIVQSASFLTDGDLPTVVGQLEDHIHPLGARC
jgi:hypothetical protein